MEDFYDFMIKLVEENKLFIYINGLDKREKQMVLSGFIGLYFCFFDFMNELIFECLKGVVVLMSGATGVLLSLILVSHLKFDKIEDDFKFYDEDVVEYEDKYPIEDIKDNETVNISDIGLNRFVQENTPDGVVFMRWNNSKEGFEYWSDNTIKYKYLEVCCRKYVKIFDCKKLYVDRTKEIMEKKEKIKEEKEREKMKLEDKKEEEKEEESVFLKLKSSKKVDKNSNEVVATYSNKYIHIGKISELNLINKKSDLKIKDKSKSKLSFQDFKRYFS